MDEDKAREILGDSIQPDDSLFSCGWYVQWRKHNSTAVLHGEFDAEDLEAIAWWMRNKTAR